ncbi:hypothetical protein, partial [Flavobacterium sp. 14A]|uniref:hypothetical protein n=1 Tax=Flavobacterium sp. 14A TaxID=2735896 RepID=UPI00156FD2A8
MQREILKTVQSVLHKKIKFTEKENQNMDDQMLEQYLEHLYGIEKRMTSELFRITNVSNISTVLSIFESKLKVICDRIITDFGGELSIESVLTPIKQEYYSKFRLLIMLLIFPLKLDVYPG